MEKLMGRDKFSELLGEFIVRPKGKLTLAPESDKCKEVSIFSEFKEEE